MGKHIYFKKVGTTDKNAWRNHRKQNKQNETLSFACFLILKNFENNTTLSLKVLTCPIIMSKDRQRSNMQEVSTFGEISIVNESVASEFV